ncbi:hypothetical protein FACS1894185_4900 [Betaproteobacteria bacterium]|nr:hypothetical protein FACS1894185_4900 [Betaproteobacteria bacterium]
MAENTVQFFGPARIDRTAGITVDGNEAIQFPAAVISATPAAIKVEPAELVEHLSDVDLEIRATDLDSTKRGWAAVITGKIDRRISLKLGEGVRPTDLNKFKVRADVSVFYKRKVRGNASELVHSKH